MLEGVVVVVVGFGMEMEKGVVVMVVVVVVPLRMASDWCEHARDGAVDVLEIAEWRTRRDWRWEGCAKGFHCCVCLEARGCNV